VSPVRYELSFYIPEEILHSHRREGLKSYVYIILSPEICVLLPVPRYTEAEMLETE
jgi:hypothetical protein